MRLKASYENDGWRKDEEWNCTLSQAHEKVKHIMNKLHSPYAIVRKENGEMLIYRYRRRKIS